VYPLGVELNPADLFAAAKSLTRLPVGFIPPAGLPFQLNTENEPSANEVPPLAALSLFFQNPSV